MNTYILLLRTEDTLAIHGEVIKGRVASEAVNNYIKDHSGAVPFAIGYLHENGKVSDFLAVRPPFTPGWLVGGLWTE